MRARSISLFVALLTQAVPVAAAQSDAPAPVMAASNADPAETAPPAATPGPTAPGSVASAAQPARAPSWKDRTEARLSGYLQARYSVLANTDFDLADQNGFDLRNARLEGSGRIKTAQGNLFVKLQGDLAGGGFSLRDGYGGWAPWNALRFSIGQMKVPFAYAILNSSRTLQLPDRQMNEQIGWGRDLGLTLSGDAELTKIAERPFVLHYAVGAFNGEGENQFSNINDRNLYAGRLLLQPLGEIGSDEPDLSPCVGLGEESCDPDASRPLRVALGASFGHDPLSARGKNFDLNRRETRWGIDAHLKWSGLSLHAEYLRGDLPATANDGAFAREGWYVQAGYNPSWFDWLEPVVRYEALDYDTARDNTGPGATPDQVGFQARTRTTFGLNAFITGYDGRLMLAYVMTDLQEGLSESPQGDPLYGDRLVLQAQIGF